MQISEAQAAQNSGRFALFELGFRPFFLGAGIFAVCTIALWAGIYLYGVPITLHSMSSFQWHAHEMIYGYSIAVIAGFLLTAVKNWTGISTISGASLAALFALWLMARISFASGGSFVGVAAGLEALFSVVLIIVASRPIIMARQWQQMAIVSKLGLVLGLNMLFYAGLFGWVENGLFWGIYGGLYLVLGLILTMGRRVVPFFIEQGVGYRVTLFNSKWLDIPGLLFFVSFFVSELFFDHPAVSAYLALALFAVNAIRLIGWHTVGIWKKSLLWSIYLSFWFITSGFLLFAASYWLGVSSYLSIHAFTYGGVGLITIGMMSRVSLGHTGRQVTQPPKVIAFAFGFLLLGAVLRVFVPLFNMSSYKIWIGSSMLLWIVAFLIFVVTYAPILIKPRVE